MDHGFNFLSDRNWSGEPRHFSCEPDARRSRHPAAAPVPKSSESVNIMRTHTTAPVALRTLLSPFALALPLALGLAACDGIDDLDAAAELDAEFVEPSTELADAEHPPITGEAVRAPEFVDDEIIDETDAAAQQRPLALSDALHPSAACFFYSQKASLNLVDQYGTLHGNVALNTNCANAYARTTITNSNVYNWQHRLQVQLQYWNANQGVWTVWQPLDSGWTSTPGWKTIETTPTNFAIGTYVRACGKSEGTLNGGATPYACTAYFQISSST